VLAELTYRKENASEYYAMATGDDDDQFNASPILGEAVVIKGEIGRKSITIL